MFFLTFFFLKTMFLILISEFSEKSQNSFFFIVIFSVDLNEALDIKH